MHPHWRLSLPDKSRASTGDDSGPVIDAAGADDDDFAFLTADGALRFLTFTKNTDFSSPIGLQPVYRQMQDSIINMYQASSALLSAGTWSDILKIICDNVNSAILPSWVNESALLRDSGRDPTCLFDTGNELRCFLRLRADCIMSLLGQFAKATTSTDRRLLPQQVFRFLGQPQHALIVAIADAVVEDGSEVYHLWYGLLTWLCESEQHCACSTDALSSFINDLKLHLGLMDPTDEPEDGIGALEQPQPTDAALPSSAVDSASETAAAPATGTQAAFSATEPERQAEMHLSTDTGTVTVSDAVVPADQPSLQSGAAPPVDPALIPGDAVVATVPQPTCQRVPAVVPRQVAASAVASDWMKTITNSQTRCRSWQFMKRFMLKAETLIVESLQHDTIAGCHFKLGDAEGSLPQFGIASNAKNLSKIQLTLCGRLVMAATPLSYTLATIGNISVFIDGQSIVNASTYELPYEAPALGWLIPHSTDAREVTMDMIEVSRDVNVKVGPANDDITAIFYTLKLKPDVIEAASGTSMIQFVRPSLPCEVAQSKPPKKRKLAPTMHRITEMLGSTPAPKRRRTPSASARSKHKKKDMATAVAEYGEYGFLLANAVVMDDGSLVI